MKAVLKKLGLSEDEIEIYLFLLRVSKAKVTEISKHLGMARTSVYRFLELLQEKSLVSSYIEKRTQVFTPLEPQRILNLLSTLKGEVEEILPDLDLIREKSLDETSVEVFRGISGMKTVMMDILSEGKDYCGIGEGDIFQEQEEIFAKQWVRQVDEKKMNGRILGTKELLEDVPIAKHEKVKFLPKALVPRIAIYVYGNKTAQFIWSSIPYTIIIDNKDVAESHRTYFDFLWSNVAQ